MFTYCPGFTIDIRIFGFYYPDFSIPVNVIPIFNI